MKKKALRQELLNNDFTVTDKGLYVGKVGDVELSIGLDANMLGNVFMINIYYNFKEELPFDDELLGEIWKRCEVAINGSFNGLELGALSTEWACGIIRNKEILKKIDFETVKTYCEHFIKAIKPIIKKYDL